MVKFGKRGIDTGATQWQLSAPAKINLGLWVGSRDSRGYHPVLSIMQSISLADAIVVTKSAYYDVTMSRREDKGPALPSSANNLITRAYNAIKSQYPEIPPVKIHVTKQIPIGAGLGGGSSDAAAIIRWAQMLMNKKMDSRMAGDLGVDVPFLICGGTAKAQGYGDNLEFLPPLTGWHVVLISPHFGLSTRRVYETFDTLSNSSVSRNTESIENVRRLLEQGTAPKLYNALEGAAWKVEPKLKGLKTDLERTSGKQWFLTGSGATYFTLLRSYHDSRMLKRDLQNSHIGNLASIEIAEFRESFFGCG